MIYKILLIVLWSGLIILAQDIPPVAVIYNTNYANGYQIAEYYSQKRNIPAQNLIGLPLSTDEVISKEYYYTMIRDPLKAELESRGIRDKIKYLVTTKGMPLKIRTQTNYCDVYNQSGGGAIESFLCVLYDENSDYCTTSRIVNPYYDKGEPFRNFSYDFIAYCPDYITGKVSYLVSRLDAYTPEEVFDMIDRSVAADTSGEGYYILDDHPGAQGFEPWAMKNASLNLASMDLERYTLYDSSTAHIVSDTLQLKPLSGYCSRGRHAVDNNRIPPSMGWSQQYGYLGGNEFKWLNGAIFTTYESFNGYSFLLQDDGCPGQFLGHKDEQNLVSDFIRDGGTAGIGNVFEPFVSGAARVDILFKYYAAGHYFIDAAYMSLSFLTGMNSVVGDPLCRISNKIYQPPANPVIGANLTLYYNFPNPFSYNTIVRYRINENSRVKLTLYNILGELVLTVPEEAKPAGEYDIPLSLKALPSGIYFYRVTANGESATGKMTFQSENRP
jgi:uncharacterized protein (TIGR03790 family)